MVYLLLTIVYRGTPLVLQTNGNQGFPDFLAHRKPIGEALGKVSGTGAGVLGTQAGFNGNPARTWPLPLYSLLTSSQLGHLLPIVTLLFPAGYNCHSIVFRCYIGHRQGAPVFGYDVGHNSWVPLQASDLLGMRVIAFNWRNARQWGQAPSAKAQRASGKRRCRRLRPLAGSVAEALMQQARAARAMEAISSAGRYCLPRCKAQGGRGFGFAGW